MDRRNSRFRLLAATAVAAAVMITTGLMPTGAQADLVKLSNGGEIRGRVESDSKTSQNAQIWIETLSGIRVGVDRKQILFVTRRPLNVEVYETRAKATPNTVKAQWDLAEWCKINKLRKQRTHHLEQIVKLEPEHQQARKLLGHVKHDGRWMSRHEAKLAQGYVKYKGKYITPQKREVLQKSKAQRAAERSWAVRIRRWHKLLSDYNPKRRQRGLANLSSINQPDAVVGLSRYLKADANDNVRMLYVKILSQIEGSRPIRPLVRQSLFDSKSFIRVAALDAIPREHYEAAILVFLNALRHKNNDIVRRAGRGLREVGDQTVILRLIDALITTHYHQIRVPDYSDTYSFSKNGSFATGGTVLPPEVEVQLRTGQLPYGVIVDRPKPMRMKLITIRRDHRNPEVLSALNALTGASHGYDKRTWRLWYNAQKNGLIKPKTAS